VHLLTEEKEFARAGIMKAKLQAFQLDGGNGDKNLKDDFITSMKEMKNESDIIVCKTLFHNLSQSGYLSLSIYLCLILIYLISMLTYLSIYL
jgi:hypothetical protein